MEFRKPLSSPPNVASSSCSSRHAEARQFWLSRVNYEQRAPHPDDLKLESHARAAGAAG